MAYRIEVNCVGCRVCAQKCPTAAISGAAKQLHVIHAVLCIDCGVCSSYCPVEECIFDASGYAAPKLKPAGRPIAVPYPDLCSGCAECADICPEGCLEMVQPGDGIYYSFSHMKTPKACTGCRECERICSDKGAIVVEWPNGVYCVSLGDAPLEFIASRKAGSLVAR
jgi:ferredoxin